MTGNDIVGIIIAGGLAILCAAIAIGAVLLVLHSIKDTRR